MKARFFTLLMVLFTIIISTGFVMSGSKDDKGKSGGHEIKIKIKSVKDSMLYLYHHFGDKQKSVDSVVINNKGEYIFKGDEELPGGIYIAYIPEKVYFEIIVNEQNFTIETDTGDFITNMKVTGSEENQLFNDYQRFRRKMYEQNTLLKNRLDANKENKDSTKVIKDIMKKLSTETEDYTMNIINNKPETFFSKVLKMTKPIDIPEAPRDENGVIIDSNFALRYHQEHYFDNIDFTDDRVLRTPLYHQKVHDYIKLLTHPAPDSVIKSIDFIIGKSKANEELFRYTLATLYNKYNAPKIMGYDAIFVHIAERYYVSGEAHWADSAFVQEISKRIREITPTLIGEKAKNIVLVDTLMRRIPLYSVEAKLTILFFYEPDCGHCKKTAPKVKAVYDEFSDKGVEVYGVCTKTDIDEWKEFIHKFDLQWINVADPNHQSNFRNFFDVRSTPILYLLDEDKTIIAKRLSADQMREVIARELGIKLPDKEDIGEEKGAEENDKEDKQDGDKKDKKKDK